MTRMIFFSYTESHEYLEWDSTNSYHPNQLNQEKKENRHVKFQNMACIYMWREENNNTVTIRIRNKTCVYFCTCILKWNIFPSIHIFTLLSNTKLNHLFLLFFFNGCSLPKNGILCIEIFVSYLLQRAATHLLRIFKGTFFTIEKDTTKSLGLRGIKTSANGGTKWRQISKIAFGRNQKFFSGNVIALSVDSDEKIKKFE